MAQAWKAHLEYNVAALDAGDALLGMGVYSSRQQDHLRHTLIQLGETPLRFGLSHGDLTTRNLLASGVGRAVLIDWGSASFGPVPLTDVLLLDRDAHRVGTPCETELRAFTEAIGFDLDKERSTFEAFRQLQLLDLVRWAMDRRPDRFKAAVADLTGVL